jgi:hypothetical protein
MRLYQHSARCPSALRSFLDCNPIYWCFIPLLWEEAQSENFACFRQTSTLDHEVAYIMESSASGNEIVDRRLSRVPVPPAAYAFSYRQQQQQRLFFEHFLFVSERKKGENFDFLLQNFISRKCERT